MKNLVLTCMMLAGLASAMAADLLVAEGGAGGAYATITDAITAAASGDRILITPKSGGGAYSENLTITNKSLQLLSATDGQYWKLTGSITFNPTTAGQSLSVISGHITSGNIVSSINAPAGARAKVHVLGCKLTSGFINFNFNNYDVNVAGDSLLAGYVYLRYGKVLGNYISSSNLSAHSVYVTTDSNPLDDAVSIIGNKINCSTNAGGLYGIYWNSSAFFYHIYNNYIDANASSAQNCIHVDNSKSSSSNSNRIINNTLREHIASYAIYVSSLGSPTLVMNNAVENDGTGNFGIAASSFNVNMIVGWNYVETSSTPYANITNDGTNFSGVSMTIDTNTGELLTGTGIDGGSPDLQYSDLDLSRNDAGCFGGSLSRENYLSATTGSTQVTLFNAPGRVLSGQSINISGEGFDK